MQLKGRAVITLADACAALSRLLWQFTRGKTSQARAFHRRSCEIRHGTVIALVPFVMAINISSLALVTALFLIPTAARGQMVARVNLSRADSRITEVSAGDNQQNVTARAIAALKGLDRDVLVYRSLGDFEESGKLARVSFDVFRNDLQAVTEEVEPLLSGLPQSRLKTEIRNALDSYRDGAFWWQKIDQPRVVHVSVLAFSESTRTSADTALLANVPYTVAIHWRQAEKYLKHAEGLLNGTSK